MLEFGYDESRDTALEAAPIPAASMRAVDAGDTYGKFVVEPLRRGYGTTLGNPLRRVLLSSIEGSAINWVRIEGVDHEYSSIHDVKEDVVDILLNIKAISLRALTNRPGKLRLEVEGPGDVCAGDIMASSDFEIVNPELHVATLDSQDAHLIMEMNVEQGMGYEPAASSNGLPIGVLPVDAIYTPVRKVDYSIERMRVGQHTDFERLVLEVWTNGAVSPADAVRRAAQELVEHFFRFSTVSERESPDGERPSWAANIPASQYNMPVESLNLTARTLNCLKRASIHRVGEILERSRSDLLRIRNFGEKSLVELDQKLGELGIRHPELHEEALAAEAGGVTSESEPEDNDDDDNGVGVAGNRGADEDEE